MPARFKNAKISIPLVVLAGAVIGAPGARAQTYTLTAQGQITSIYDPDQHLDGSVVNGTPWSATVTLPYPMASVGGSPNGQYYFFPSTSYGLTATFGDYTYAPGVNSYGSIEVALGVADLQSQDPFWVYSGLTQGDLTSTSGPVTPPDWSQFAIWLYDSTGTYQDSTALPTSIDLSGFDSKTVEFYQEFDGANPVIVDADIESVTVTPDASAPVTAASLSQPANTYNWFNAPVTITLSATEPNGPSTVAATYYTIDGGTTQTYTAPFTISGNGNHTVNYWSEDLAANVEPATTYAINIDGTPPQTTLSVSGNQVTLTATDNASYVLGTYYSVDGGSQTTYTAPFTLSSGSHTVVFHSIDHAGNVEADQTQPVTI